MQDPTWKAKIPKQTTAWDYTDPSDFFYAIGYSDQLNGDGASRTFALNENRIAYEEGVNDAKTDIDNLVR
jgi:hypothetical protein